MNRTYALVWNHCLGAWSVADEHARRCGKGAGAVLAAALLLPGLALAADLPTGGNIISGSGQIGTPNSNQMVIDQASNKLAIDWQSFDIAAGHKVTFNQPGSDSIALNRVLGADGSKIMGQLDANGRVFIINPNGVLFGAGASVNVGGLVASTLDLSVSDFEAGNYQFKGNGSNASVINNGQITAADGGSIALLGGTVSNNGVIVANQGSVTLAAGNAMTLDFAGDGLLNVQVDEALVDALVENHQLIRADGGQVLLTANAGEALLKTVVNNTGVIEARTLGEKDGKIVLLGDFAGGTVSVAGTLDASAPNGGNGGFVDTSGAHVKVADGAKVTTLAANGQTGVWLIDPTDFTVSAGSAAHTDSGIGAETLSNNLNSTSVILQTVAADNGTDKGDIHVNADITYTANQLTLTAHNAINLNAVIYVNGSGTLAMNHGAGSINASFGESGGFKGKVNFAGSGAGLLTINGAGYTVIKNMSALQGMVAGNYALGGDLDASNVANFAPIVSFTGIFDGLGHTISGLTINRPDQDNVGLFGSIYNATLRNVGLEGGSVTGKYRVGGLVGLMHSSHGSRASISHAYATGAVTGSYDVGGLVGSSSSNFGSSNNSISHAYAMGAVTGPSNVGGLVGSNSSLDSSNSSISHAYATGAVTGPSNVGGLVGDNSPLSGGGTSITDSFWDTNTTGQSGSAGGGTGKSTAEMQTQATYAGWDFDSTWRIGATGAGTDGYAFYGLPTLQGVTRKTDYQYFDSGLGTEASPWTLTNWQQLQNINTNATTLAGYFQLKADLDQNSQGYHSLASATANDGAGWKPLGDGSSGTDDTRFTGTLKGQGHTIGDLVVNVTSPSYSSYGTSWNYAGLFGVIGSASIAQLGLVNASVSASGASYSFAGGLAGNVIGVGTISQSYVSGGSVSAFGGSINIAGGLVGSSSGSIHQSYANASVSARGGDQTRAGGLVGSNGGTVTQSYVSGGSVSAIDSPENRSGGLLGINSVAQIGSDNFWDSAVHEQGFGISYNGATFAAIKKSTAELKQASTFAGWDISSNGGENTVWRIYEGHTGPLLRSFLKQATVTADTSGITGKTYDGTAASGNLNYTTNVPGAALDGTLSYATNSKNAATYSTADNSLTISKSLYSDQQGYDISYASTNTSLTIDKADLAVSGISANNKTYDATNAATLTGTAGVAAFGTDVVSVTGTGVGTFANKDAGTGKAVTVTGYSLTGIDAGNYNIVQPTGLTANISKADLAVSGISASDKTYDATTTATLTGTASVAAFGGDVVAVTGTGAGTFADKNAGTSKAVTVSGYTLSGADAGNYNIVQPTGLTAGISKADLAVSGISASDKTYDATTTATLTGTAGVAAFGSDVVAVTGTGAGTFADKNAGTGKAVTVTGYSLTGSDAGNYNIVQPTGLNADIDKAALTITADDASKIVGQRIALSGYTTSGLVGGDSVTSVSLASAGEPASAAAGNYAIVASDAIGSALSNYDIQYEDGSLQVTAAAVAPPLPNANSTTLPYASVLASNGQTVSAESKQQAQEPEALSQDMLVTNPLDERMNLQVINHGIRLPEGI